MLEDWRRAGTQVRTARTRAGIPATAFARRAGVSPRTLWALEHGERATFSDDTLDRVEAELGWAPGSIRAIAEGRRRPRYDELLQRVIDRWPLLDQGARRIIAELADRASR